MSEIQITTVPRDAQRRLAQADILAALEFIEQKCSELTFKQCTLGDGTASIVAATARIREMLGR